MKDPWHEETLTALLSYLQAGPRSARAVIVTSGDALKQEVESDLRVRLGNGRRIVEIDLSTDPDFVGSFVDILRRVSEPEWIVFVQGAPRLVSRQRVEEPDKSPGLLSYLNWNRELFERRDDAFIFFLDGRTATAMASQAPDFNRYTSWFEFLDWDDLVSDAGRDVDQEVAQHQGLEKEEEEALMLIEIYKQSGSPSVHLFDALLYRAHFLERMLRLPEAIDCAKEAVELARKIGKINIEVSALVVYSVLLVRTGRVHEAGRLLDDSVTKLPGMADKKVKAMFCNVYGLALGAQGLFGRALKEYEISVRSWHSIADFEGISLSYSNSSETLMYLGDLYAAREKAAVALSNAHRAQSVYAESDVLSNQTNISLITGDLHGAAHTLGRALVLAETSQNKFVWTRSLLMLAQYELISGRPQRSGDLVARLLSTVRESRLLEYETIIATNKAYTLLVTGQTALAQQLAEAAVNQARTAGFRPQAAEAEMALGLALEAQGALPVAADRLRDAAEEFRVMQQKLLLAAAEMHQGRIQRLQGYLDVPNRLLQSSLGKVRAAGARPAEARVLTELSFLALAQGQVAEARRRAEEALVILRETHTRLDEPAALAAMACAHRAAGRLDHAEPIDKRWRRLVDGMEAPGLRARIERSIRGLTGIPEPAVVTSAQSS